MVKRPGYDTWGSVCDDAFQSDRNPDTFQDTGNVACRSLGFQRMVSQSRSSDISISGLKHECQNCY